MLRPAMADDSLPTREAHPITAYRARHDISCKEFARRTGLAQSHLWRGEDGGVGLPTIAVLQKLVAATNGEVSELDLFFYHLAAAGIVPPRRAPMTAAYTWRWVKPPIGTEPAQAFA